MPGRLRNPTPPVLERDLLLRAITGNTADGATAYMAWRSTVSFAEAIDPETSALLPLLYHALLARGLDDPQMGMLKGVCRRAWYENQTLLANAEQALRSLARNQIACVLIGDIPLVLSQYKNLHARQIGQIDLVVSPRQALLAARLLGADGWETDSPLVAEEVTYRHVKRFKGPAGRALDLHWHFIGSASSTSADDFFRSSTSPCRLNDMKAIQLSPTAMFIASMFADSPKRAAMPALWVADALAIIGRSANELNWAEVIAFAGKEKLASRLRQKLQLLISFGGAIPELAAHMPIEAKASLPEAIDRILLLSDLRRRNRIPPYRWGVVADYLRSDCRPGPSHGVTDFLHFLRHRWGLRGRREIIPAVARQIWRNAGLG